MSDILIAAIAGISATLISYVTTKDNTNQQGGDPLFKKTSSSRNDNSAKVFIVCTITDQEVTNRLNNIRQRLGLNKYDLKTNQFHFTLLQFDVNIDSPLADIILAPSQNSQFIPIVKKAFNTHIKTMKLQENSFEILGGFLALEYLTVNNNGQIIGPNDVNHPIREFRQSIWFGLSDIIADRLQLQKPYTRKPVFVDKNQIKWSNADHYIYNNLYAIPEYYYQAGSRMHVSIASKDEMQLKKINISTYNNPATKELQLLNNGKIVADNTKTTFIPLLGHKFKPFQTQLQNCQLHITLSAFSTQKTQNDIKKFQLKPIDKNFLISIPDKLKNTFDYYWNVIY